MREPKFIKSAIVLLLALGLFASFWEFWQIPFSRSFHAENWDVELNGTNWYLSGWHLENATDYTREFYNGEFHGFINDTKGDTIYSVSCVQGYYPQKWGVKYWDGSDCGRNKLKIQGYPQRLKVTFRIANWTFNLDSEETYCNFCWNTVGIDIRGSIRGKNYNASHEMGGESWVLCANLFEVKLIDNKVEFSEKNEILLKTHELDYGTGVERLYHYSVAILDSEDVEMNEWVEIDIDLRKPMQDMECGFQTKFIAKNTHLVQPFIETCGGSVEAYLDYVVLY